MKTDYFQGKDGYVWWHGVVEDRKDPLFLGRCRVRILGWHTENKTELPTDMLPWAQALMPITSASQVGVGQAPVGPVEGTWVMGYYRDGELAQEPVMVGTLHGIPERYAIKDTGFYDSRLDTPDKDRQGMSDSGKSLSGGTPATMTAFPFPPKNIETVSGGEVKITEFTDAERRSKSFMGGSAANSWEEFQNPRNVNVPTTSVYARGEDDDSTKVNTTGIIAFKNRNRLATTITTAFKPNAELQSRIPAEEWDTLNNASQDITKISQPPSPYGAKYPFNHVYESESGHLIEIDDTPSKERLHWYHRSGTFTEFHPKGIRTDRTMGHHYNIVTGNEETYIRGAEKKAVSLASIQSIGGKAEFVSGKDMKIISEAGNLTVDAPTGITTISGNQVFIDAKNVLTLKGAQIVRDDDSAVDEVKGDYGLTTQGKTEISAGALKLGTPGRMDINAFGGKAETIGGSSEETIGNVDVALGNVNAKLIKAMLGKIVLECLDPVATGGLELNLGPGGAAGQVSIAQLGDITISTKTGPGGITLSALLGPISITTPMTAEFSGATGVTIGSAATPVVDIKGVSVNVGGSDSPALLAKDFLDLFKDHTHPSPNGPTGPLSPKFAPKLTKTMAKKVFLA
ncbi:MAG: hypothetical protein QGH83_01460 [Candidatus Pacebacteria bacterium]|nr:hypothetical protein [Candidatus Paceibacterota bacterium]